MMSLSINIIIIPITVAIIRIPFYRSLAQKIIIFVFVGPVRGVGSRFWSTLLATRSVD